MPQLTEVNVSPELYPFKSQWLALPEGNLHYLDEGPRIESGATTDSEEGDPDPAAPVLLFVHGNPTWSFHWRRLIEGLRGTCRCVAIDHLGCGLSDKPNQAYRLADRIEHLGALIDHLDLDQITLVAQDWGGAIGLGAMLDRQEKLGRVLLYNTGAFPPWFVPHRINVCKTPFLGKLALQGLNLFSRTAIRMTIDRTPKLDRAVADAYLAPYSSWENRKAVYEFVADIPRSSKHPTWQTLASIESRLPQIANKPIRLVWGMKDWCFTPACLEKFIAYWPNAEVLKLHDVGHWVVEDAPTESLQQLKSLLGEPLKQ